MKSISHNKLQFTTHNLTTGHQDITTTTFHGQLHYNQTYGNRGR